ncbi:hypothetical protein ONZ45_g5054 [Pleurotus djamor]|nr:hypothetical protein ONZ45_g5054 [Pleurotus djamor]
MSVRDNYNGLTPPIGTSFFKMTDILLLDDQDFPPYDTDLRVTWGVTLYKYAVNASPTDPDFQAKNGRIYIVMVHRGSFSRAASWTMQMLEVSLDKSEKTVILDTITPGQNSGVAQEDGSVKYSINYTQQMPMFKNQGNEVFVFEARYQNDYVLQVQQNGSTFPSEHEFGYSKETDKNVGLTAINGLSVLQCLDPTKEIKLTFGHVGAAGVQQISEFYQSMTINVGEF